MDTVTWTDTPDRDTWWRDIMGLDDSATLCDTADLADQNTPAPFDDDLYPTTTRT